jgi:hypothetical protein
VVPGLDGAHRAQRQVGVGGLAGTAAPDDPVAGHGDEVAEHRAGGRLPAGPAAVEHELARGLGLHEDRVERLPDAGEGVRVGDHCRVHPHGHGLAAVGVRAPLADGEELDHGVHLAGGGDVGGGDRGDALAVHVAGGDAGVEGEAGEDRGLRRGVEALDVRGGVGLGVPERLGLLERLGEAHPGRVHLVEDEVGRAVDDAEHPAHPVAGE